MELRDKVEKLSANYSVNALFSLLDVFAKEIEALQVSKVLDIKTDKSVESEECLETKPVKSVPKKKSK